MENNELYHYGVKGMKWGVRKKISDGIKRSQAKFVLKRFANDFKTGEKLYNRRANREYRKYEKLKAKGDKSMTKDGISKAKDHQIKGHVARDEAQIYMRKKLAAEGLLSEIKNKSVELGKDYLVKQEIKFGKTIYRVEDTKRNKQYELTMRYT